MMKFKQLVAYALLPGVLLLSACAAGVKKDFDPAVDFSALQTFQWQSDAKTVNDILDRRIRSSIETTLKAQGYTLALSSGASSADLRVTYRYQVTPTRSAQPRTGVSVGGGSGGAFGGIGLSIPLGGKKAPEGELAIDIIAADSQQLIWRGFLAVRLQGDEPAETTANVDQAVRKILAEFPPES